MLNDIGRIVATARSRAGRSRASVAAEASISEKTLADLEEGRPGATTTQLERVAIVLELEPSALLRGREAPLARPSVFFRQATFTDFDHSDLPQLDRALRQAQLILELVEQLSIPSGPRRRGVFRVRDASGVHPAQEGYELARDVRSSINNHADPVDDPRHLVEVTLEVALVVARLRSTRATAISIRSPSGAAAIVLNASDPERAQNPLLASVHVAHELCHVLFDPSAGGIHLVVDVVSDRRDLRAEQRARAFAAELLLPTAGLTKLLGPPKGIVEANSAYDATVLSCRHFSTPYEIAANHLCNVGFVDRQLREWLVQSDGPGRRRPPHWRLPKPGQPSLYLRRLVRAAHEDSLVTDGEAKDVLGLDVLAPLPWDTQR